MSFETLREKVWVFFPPLIALVRLHGWITKTAIGVQYKGWGGSSGAGEARRRVMCPRIFPSFSLSLSLPTALGFHNSAIKVDGREGLLQSEASAVNVSSV